MKTAHISNCGMYRYTLRRQWSGLEDFADPQKFVCYIMLNPSTADAEKDDPTIRSCMRLAKEWGYHGLRVVNLFAYRATKPNDLALAHNPVGEFNDWHVRTEALSSDFVIVAWGAHKMANPDRVKEVLHLLPEEKPPHCLGKTKSGAPKHPLYIKSGTTPELY